VLDLKKALESLDEIVQSDIVRSDFPTFCERYVNIEDVDSAAGYTKFVLWPAQREIVDLLEGGARRLILLKARQLGFTTTVSTWTLYRALRNPGFTALIISDTDRQANEIIQQLTLVLDEMPRGYIRRRENYRGRNITPTALWYEATATELRIGRRDGRRSRLVCRPSTVAGARSFTANVVIADEMAFYEHADAVFEAMQPTVNRQSGGQLVLISTNKIGSLYDHIYREKLSVGFPAEGDGWVRHFSPWWGDPRRDDEWYRRTELELKAAGKTMHREFPATELEALEAGEGKVFPEFDPAYHVCSPFPLTGLDCRIVCGYDPGYYDPAVLLTVAITRSGVYLVDEYDVRGKTYGEQAMLFEQRIKSLISRGMPAPEYVVTDRQAWARTGKAAGIKTTAIADYFRNFPWSLVRSIKDREASVAAIHAYLLRLPTGHTDENGEEVLVPSLHLFSSCIRTITSLQSLYIDPKNPDTAAASPLDHWFDALAYILNSKALPEPNAPKPEKKSLIRRHKEMLDGGARKRRYVRT
jgi:hypothetical protein